METITQNNELIKTVEESGLEQATANYIKEKFLPFFEQAEDWKRKAESLIVTDISQVREMEMARQARLALKNIRVNADKTRKELKEDSLRYGKAVQGVYNVIDYLIVPIEKHLEQQEKFAEIQEANKRAELKASREIELQPFAEFVPIGINLGNLSEDDYNKTLNGAKLQLQAKIDEEKRIENERIAKEKAEAEERERIRIENEKLKAEALEKERALAIEREKVEKERKALEEKNRKEKEAIEAKLKAEALEKEKIASELRAKKDAEEKALKDKLAKAELELKEAAKLAKAPIKKQLNIWVNSFEIPVTNVDNETSKAIQDKFSSFKNWALTQVDSL